MMGCACENKKRMSDIANMRSLARKAAILDGKVYVLYENNGIFSFCPRGEGFKGKFIEFVWF